MVLGSAMDSCALPRVLAHFHFRGLPDPQMLLFLSTWPNGVSWCWLRPLWCGALSKPWRTLNSSRKGTSRRGFGWSLKLLWTLQNITLMPAFFVSLVYWIFLFEPGAWRCTFFEKMQYFDMISYQVCSMPSYLYMSVVVVLVNTMLCRLYLYRVYRCIVVYAALSSQK